MATKISTAFNYIELLVFPHPLSADYSYNSIAYKNFTDPIVWSSLIFYGGLVFIMFRSFLKRKDHDPHNFRIVICFALAFYFLNFLLICNWIFNLGGTMGERLIYHSSIGFAIALACLLVMGAEKIRSEKMRNAAIVIFLALIILLSGYKTIIRNAEWKNNRTLFTADLKIVPNSVIVLGNVVTALLEDADQIRDSAQRKNELEKAITLSEKATSIDPQYVAGFFNRGLAFYKLGNMEQAKNCMDSVKGRYANYPLLPSMNKRIGVYYLEQGSNVYGRSGKWAEAVTAFKKGIAADDSSPELWFNLGVAYYAIHDVNGAVDAWKNALRLKPDHQQAQQDLNFVLGAGSAKQTK